MHTETNSIRVPVLMTPRLLRIIDAYRRDAAGLPSRSEVIRAAVEVFAAQPATKRTRHHRRRAAT